MPDKGPKNQLYGSDLVPASPWASNAQKNLVTDSTSPLYDQSQTELSAEAYVRGSTKYMEQAEELLQQEETEQANSAEVQAALAQNREEEQDSEKETEELIGSALASFKGNEKTKTNALSQINNTENLMWIAAFGN